MRQSNINLVNRIRKEYGYSNPIYDIGGGGFKHMWNFPVFSVDISDQADIVADCTDMPQVRDNTAATVISCDTFEHVKDPFKAIDEIYRIMKPGGLLILSTVLTWGYHEYPGDYFRYTVEGLEHLCSKFEKLESGWSRENVPLA